MSGVFQKLRLFQRFCQCLNRTFAYKSVYNLENLYPAAKDFYVTHSSQPTVESTEKFNGHIPIKKVKIKYSKSSGPGGQHVNTTDTKAEVRFHVMSADWIPEELRSVILSKFRKRINKAGELIVWSDDSRYQLNNLKNCLDQIREFIKEAEKPPDTSKEERIAKLNDMESIQKAHIKRLRKKRLKTHFKSMRNTFD